MNGGQILKMSFFDKIGTFFDIIPKLIYFMATIFMSVIDVLQCMVRKLAGLDVYYAAVGESNTTVAVAQQDPLTEFIFGILGYGQSASLYKGLNTVFWSLAIFAVVCLCVTSMIAIIKSHYNEDANATNPWKYIYTAIKAVLTFAIVPFAVVIGMQLASWVLRTVDSITAGSATEETMRSTFGDNYKNVFTGGKIDGQKTSTEYYTRYDFFGLGMTTTSTPFSGTIFKACTYNANRARKDSDFAAQLLDVKDFAGQQVFKETKVEPGDQVDFAFANNLKLTNGIGGVQLQSALHSVKYWSVTDLINGLTGTSWSFTKFNVGLVWMFYNLWSYDFIVAFVAGVTVVGIMLSVIIGLMSRLMKGAILFLIYPALLGIAPLDNFKAFKSWTTQFMQQVLMAFGAIIGMNLTLLVLPYVNNIKWFNLWILDNLINTIVMITGLMMMKDIISMISNFVGGADANQAGSALKGEVGKGIATGAKITGKAALAFGKGTAQLAAGGAKLIGKGISGIKGGEKGKLKNTVNAANTDVTTKRSEAAAAETEVQATSGALDDALTKARSTGMQRAAKDAENEVMKSDKYQDPNTTDAERQAMRDEAKRNARRKYYEEHKDENWGTAVTSAGEAYDAAVARKSSADAAATAATTHAANVAKVEGLELSGDGTIKIDDKGNVVKHKKTEAETEAEKAEMNVQKYGLKTGYTSETDKEGNTVYKDKYGREVDITEAAQTKWGKRGEMLNDFASFKEAGKHLADGFLKSVTDLGTSLGLDKLLTGMGDIFKGGVELKGGVFDKEEPKKEGDKLTSEEHAKTREAQKKNTEESTKAIVKAIEELGKRGGSGGGGDGIAKAAADMRLAAKDLKTIADTLKDFKPGSGSGSSGS